MGAIPSNNCKVLPSLRKNDDVYMPKARLASNFLVDIEYGSCDSGSTDLLRHVRLNSLDIFLWEVVNSYKKSFEILQRKSRRCPLSVSSHLRQSLIRQKGSENYESLKS